MKYISVVEPARSAGRFKEAAGNQDRYRLTATQAENDLQISGGSFRNSEYLLVRGIHPDILNTKYVYTNEAIQ